MVGKEAIIVICMITVIINIKVIAVQHPRTAVTHLRVGQVANQLQAVRRQIIGAAVLQRINIVLWILMMTAIMISMKMMIMIGTAMILMMIMQQVWTMQWKMRIGK